MTYTLDTPPFRRRVPNVVPKQSGCVMPIQELLLLAGVGGVTAGELALHGEDLQTMSDVEGNFVCALTSDDAVSYNTSLLPYCNRNKIHIRCRRRRRHGLRH